MDIEDNIFQNMGPWEKGKWGLGRECGEQWKNSFIEISFSLSKSKCLQNRIFSIEHGQNIQRVLKRSILSDPIKLPLSLGAIDALVHSKPVPSLSLSCIFTPQSEVHLENQTSYKRGERALSFRRNMEQVRAFVMDTTYAKPNDFPFFISSRIK